MFFWEKNRILKSIDSSKNFYSCAGYRWANLLFVGAGGGKFMVPEKPVKEVIYYSNVYSAEGLFCSLTDNKNCVKYNQEREY